MLIQLIAQQPQILGTIVKNTPHWVWGLLGLLCVLGLSQARTRNVGVARMALMPSAMAALSLWGTASAFGGSPLFVDVLLAWGVAAALMVGLLLPMALPAGATYDTARRRFTVPGSWLPLALTLGIFLVKYTVGVELAMQPGLAADGTYSLVAGGLYGLFTGAFAGRAARLWRLALRPAGAGAAVLSA